MLPTQNRGQSRGLQSLSPSFVQHQGQISWKYRPIPLNSQVCDVKEHKRKMLYCDRTLDDINSFLDFMVISFKGSD